MWILATNAEKLLRWLINVVRVSFSSNIQYICTLHCTLHIELPNNTVLLIFPYIVQMNFVVKWPVTMRWLNWSAILIHASRSTVRVSDAPSMRAFNVHNPKEYEKRVSLKYKLRFNILAIYI